MELVGTDAPLLLCSDSSECVPRHVIVILWEIWKTVNLSMVLGDHNSEFSSFIQRFALFSRRTLHSLNSGVNVRR